MVSRTRTGIFNFILPTIMLMVVAAPSALAGDVDHRRAVTIARQAVSGGTAVVSQDEIFDGVEDSYEVKLIINNGRKLVDIEIERSTGQVRNSNVLNQSSSQRQFWLQILNLIDNAQLDFKNAQKKALARYPDASIFQIKLDVESGELQYDVDMVDVFGSFTIEINALTGVLSNDLDRGITFKNATAKARVQAGNSTLVGLTLLKVNANWRYHAVLTSRRGRKETTVKINAATGAIISSKTRNSSRRLRRGYKKMIVLERNAVEGFTSARALTLAELGNGFPTTEELFISSGNLYYKSTYKTFNRNDKVWIDATTGAVWKRR